MPDRGLPQDIEAEQYVLGACMSTLQARYEATELLEPVDFFRQEHQDVFRVICQMTEQGKPVDHFLVSRRLPDLEGPDMSGQTYLRHLVDRLPHAQHARQYAQRVRDCAILREYVSAGQAISAAAMSTMTMAEIREAIDCALLAPLRKRDGEHNGVNLQCIAPDVYRSIQERQAGLRGVATGLVDLDNYLSGMRKGHLVMVGARTSQGKTSLVIRILLHIAQQKGHVAVFTTEMGANEYAERMMAVQADVDLQMMANGCLPPAQAAKLPQATEQMTRMCVDIDDRAGITPLYVRNHAQRLHGKRPLALLVIDHLHEMRPTNKHDSEVQALGEIGGEVKQLARDLNVPVLCAVQCSRGPENRPDKEPTLADIRGSGRLEEEADAIILLHQPDYYKRRANEQVPAVWDAALHVAKNRHGPTGKFRLAFRAASTRFDNWSDDYRRERTQQAPVDHDPFDE